MSRSCWFSSPSASSHAARRHVGVGVGVGKRNLEERALSGERGAQLVGGVGDEMTLRLEGRFQALEEVVECPSELGELIVWAVKIEPAVKVGCRDLSRGRGDGSKRAEESAGEPPRSSKRNGCDREDDGGRAEIEVVVGAALLSSGARSGPSCHRACPEEEVGRLEEDAGPDQVPRLSRRGILRRRGA